MTGEMGRDRCFTTLDGLQLYYREYRPSSCDGPTLLCLPGLTRNGRDYEELAQYLENQGLRVLCPDLRGRGQSEYDPNWRNYKFSTYMADLQQLLVIAGVTHFAAIGTSLGGMLAMALAAALPALVSGVILNDVGPDFDEGNFTDLLNYLKNEQGHADEATAIAHVKRVQAHLNIEDETGWRNYAHRLYRKDDRGRFNLAWDKAILNTFEAETITDTWPLFRQIRHVPVLLIRGETSTILSATTAARMAREHPDLELFVVSGVGHPPVLNEPGLPEAIEVFARKHDQPNNPIVASLERLWKLSYPFP